ncbi:hypothetical protein [Cryptosporangium minutisporangium]
MGTFLTENVPVSLAGTLGSAGNFRLFACDQPDVVLYVAKTPTLMLDRDGQPAVAVTTYTTQAADGSVKVTSGAATIGVNTAPPLDQAAIDEAKARLGQLGYDPAKLRFLPLTTQKGKARLNLATVAGEPDRAHNERDVGNPGGSLSFLASLTEVGALEWSQGIKQHTRITGDITIQFDYLRRVPDMGATVRVHGQRVFDHFSAALQASYNGFFYGGSAKIEAAWDELSRNGGVEVVFQGQGLPPELEKYRQEMVTTFTKQATAILFDQIFAPMPQVAPAEPDKSGGIFGGANFALKWQKKTDAIDLVQDIQFRGTTWLTETMDVSLAALLGDLPQSCLTEIPAQQAFDSVVVVDADPMLSNAAVSMTWSEGRSPVAPVFGSEGGQQRYTVVSTNPNAVTVTCNTNINYKPRWPVVVHRQSRPVSDRGNSMVIKSAASVGRQDIFLFIREGNRILMPPANISGDYLVLNVSYEGPHLPVPVRDSAHIDAGAPVEFAYPLDPDGRPGIAKFSAFGVIGGQLKRAGEQVIPQTDSAVFILATRGGDIQLVTSETILGESDNLAADLVRGQGRPVVLSGGPAGSPAPETTRAGRNGSNRGPSSNGQGRVISGRTIGIEYGSPGPALWLRLPDGTSQRIGLRSSENWSAFEHDSRDVKVYMEPAGEFAERIYTPLTV